MDAEQIQAVRENLRQVAAFLAGKGLFSLGGAAMSGVMAIDMLWATLNPPAPPAPPGPPVPAPVAPPPEPPVDPTPPEPPVDPTLPEPQ